ncbi:MAG: isoleucine--tRNA ligase, partial [Dehalococcoidia bacterium]
VIPRYKTMKGYCCPRKAGWDTHGLPVELEIERELGFSSKADIEAYGVADFNARCRESVFRYVREWDDLTERIGFWLDMEHPYVTLENSYIESCWWVIKQLWDKGLIYQGYKVTPHCPRCGTTLSSHEVALGYEETDDPSIWVKFKLDPTEPRVDELFGDWQRFLVKPAYFLAWTTTPWTLPGNTALAVAPDADYSVMEGPDEYLIMASALVSTVGLEGYSEVARVKGSDLEELIYEPLYYAHAVGEQPEKPGYRVIPGDFISMDEGTGIVHIAPAYGDIDLEVGRGEELPLVHNVLLNGEILPVPLMFTIERFRDLSTLDVRSYHPQIVPGAGKFVKDADPLIIEDLKSRGLLYRSESIRHTYPFCWRCATPLLYYAKPSWYIRTTAKKARLISGNEEINWYPEHIKRGRFGDWLENNVDWAFSRERYWGTPLPVWRCQDCDKDECIGSIEELKGKSGLSGLEEPLDLHRPFVDEVSFECSQCGGAMRRVPDVLDAWFDSGAMPVAQWHYPFENEEKFKEFFPADYICEAVDQTRGWFYTLHAVSTLLFDKPCFRNVICLGHILDATGEKMSKSKGNVIDPLTILNSHGADALRWYLLTSSPAGNVRRFSAELVGEGLKRFLLTLWNVYSFFVTYANIDKFDPCTTSNVSCEAELDRWIISELNQLIDRVSKALESYNPTDAGRGIQEFVEDLSNWYVRRSRRRFWKSENDADKLSAYATLYHCLVTLSKLLAPLTPFVADEIYQNLVRPFYPNEPESVHLAQFPVADLSQVDEQLIEDTHLAMKISSLGRAARSKAGIKVRQPLAEVKVLTRSSNEWEGLKRVASQVLEELNVKEVNLLPPDRKEEVVNKPGWSLETEASYWVAIDTNITPELADEGMAREIVHRLQTMRKKAGFDIADYIMTYYQGGEALKRVVSGFAPYIKQETLSRDLSEGIPPDAYHETHKIAGEEIVLGVRKSPGSD